MSHEDADIVWVVVSVISGVPDTVEVYRDQKSALARERVWRQDLRPDYDEVGVFEVEIGVQSSD
jgi:hypothetical protein